MAEVHQLVFQFGREGAKNRVSDPSERRLVDIAADILAEENHAFGITYSGFCLTCLPHGKPKDLSTPWERKGHKITLLIEPQTFVIRGEQKKFGVPYGPRARLIMFYLQTKALMTGSPEVELGKTMTGWLNSMGVTSMGGETYRSTREQVLRIASSNMTFFMDHEEGAQYKGTEFTKASIIERGFLVNPNLNGQRALWDDTVVLSNRFFNEIKAHPVPVSELAIKSLRESSLALDIYVWLAYRLHVLKQDTPISWLSLYSQFGAGYRELKHFKPRFLSALQMALAAYPNARVSLLEEKGREGLLLHPSRPAVPSERLTPLLSTGT